MLGRLEVSSFWIHMWPEWNQTPLFWEEDRVWGETPGGTGETAGGTGETPVLLVTIGGMGLVASRLPATTSSFHPISQNKRGLALETNWCREKDLSLEKRTSAKPSPFTSTKRKPLSCPWASTMEVPRGRE